MKRTMNKALALIMALAMVLSLVVVAQAADAPNITATPATNAVGITGATFTWDEDLSDDDKTDFATALTAVGVDLNVATTVDDVTLSGLPTNYSFANAAVDLSTGSGVYTIMQSSTTIGTLTVTAGTLSAGSTTIKLKPGSATTTSGDEVTDEADADNTESAISGGGFYEGYVDQEVFRVVLPAVTPAALAFTIDPQGLIAATANNYAAARDDYNGKKFTEEGSMFFLNTTNKASVTSGGSTTEFDYSPDSDHFKVINKGACDVNVEVVVSAIGTALSGDEPTLSFVSSGDAFGDSTDHSLYIGLSSKVSTASGDPTVAAIAKDGSDYKATATGTVGKTDDYEYTYSGGNYAYSLKGDATDFEEFEFWLSGAANTNATDDWGLTTGSIGLAVTWKITKVSDNEEGGTGPKATATAGAVASGTTIPISVTNATGYTVTGIYWNNGETRTDFPASRVAIGEMSAEGTCTVTLTSNSAFAGSSETKVYVVLDKDGTETPLEVTVKG